MKYLFLIKDSSMDFKEYKKNFVDYCQRVGVSPLIFSDSLISIPDPKKALFSRKLLSKILIPEMVEEIVGKIEQDIFDFFIPTNTDPISCFIDLATKKVKYSACISKLEGEYERRGDIFIGVYSFKTPKLVFGENMMLKLIKTEIKTENGDFYLIPAPFFCFFSHYNISKFENADYGVYINLNADNRPTEYLDFNLKEIFGEEVVTSHGVLWGLDNNFPEGVCFQKSFRYLQDLRSET